MNSITPSRPSFPRLARLVAASALGLGLLGATGCTMTAESPAVAEQSAVKAEPAGAPGAILVASLDEIGLRADQQQKITTVREGLTAQAAPVREARTKLGAALAAQVRAGKLDHASLDPLVSGLTDAITATKPAMQQAMNDLHASLDQKQRQDLVASMRGKMEKMHERGEGRDRMQKLAKQLELTDAQVDTIKGQVKSALMQRAAGHHGDLARVKDRMEAIATAFESDQFDAKALDVGDQGAVWAKRRAEMVGAVLDSALPTLTPAQRAKLADVITARTQAGEE